MRIRNRIRRTLGDSLRHQPRVRSALVSVENSYLRARQSLLRGFPSLAKPRTYKVMIAITGRCNALCKGCRYERDFMVGETLSYEHVAGVLDDSAAAGFYTVRFYGGEPTLHPDLPRMVEHSIKRGLRPYVTTNATTLEQTLDGLYEAGMRDMSIGMYGIGEEYDEYTQRPGSFARVERGIAAARERYGDELRMQMNWLLMRPRLDVESLHRAVGFANRYGMTMQFDLLHYSLPYFQQGIDAELQFRPADRPRIEALVAEIIQLKRDQPDLIAAEIPGLRSIPEWVMLGPRMRVPCNASEMIWVGPDGSVQMCYVCFPLGNLHQTQFKDILFSKQHREFAKDSFELNCPNCHCSYNERVMRHRPSLREYSTG